MDSDGSDEVASDLLEVRSGAALSRLVNSWPLDDAS